MVVAKFVDLFGLVLHFLDKERNGSQTLNPKTATLIK